MEMNDISLEIQFPFCYLSFTPPRLFIRRPGIRSMLGSREKSWQARESLPDCIIIPLSAGDQ